MSVTLTPVEVDVHRSSGLVEVLIWSVSGLTGLVFAVLVEFPVLDGVVLLSAAYVAAQSDSEDLGFVDAVQKVALTDATERHFQTKEVGKAGTSIAICGAMKLGGPTRLPGYRLQSWRRRDLEPIETLAAWLASS